ncbi:MAG: ABC transporter ATP-binding protein/permease, partial [Candidatus Dependentiae bacterium]|nr:ABC transporter ATP-binding protein/permease [Candidatus Dependentiae bacterium]
MGIFQRWAARPAKSVKVIAIDFRKPWWTLFTAQQAKIAGILAATLVYEVMDTLFPLLIGWVLNSGRYSYLVFAVLPYLIEEVASWILIRPLMAQFISQTMESFRCSAYTWLLGIDPRFHTRRSVGVSTGKIRRTAEAYFKLVRKLLDDLVPLAITLTTAIISLISYNLLFGIVSGTAFISIGLLFCYLIVSATRTIERQVNRDDDHANHLGSEALTRFSFIRASFASDQMREHLREGYLRVMRSATTFYMTHRLMRGFFSFTYLSSIGGITAFLIYLVSTGAMTSVIAFSLLIVVLRSTAPLLKLDKYVTDIVSAHRKITDFYEYVRRFGNQSYPVFADELREDLTHTTCHTDPISLSIEHATVSYDEREPLLRDISMHVTVSRSEKNKLYGIIGPSGIGKTTFISLIGGQLRPSAGHVLINGCDIYEITDQQRQRLIALQEQLTTNVHGTIKYNLAFGLPQQHAFRDEALIALLESVGLWRLFEKKHGLATIIGDGGIALSGGQRQRLNFANLYLRAQTYKPSLILIDEPTSSLDEISEHKITDLISKLAEESLTLVIAHRLKTL